MKKNLSTLFLLSTALCLFSCTDDSPETFDNQVYFDRASNERVTELTVSIHDTYTQKLTARVPLKAEQDIRVTFGVSEDLVAEYNHFYGESAELLPSEHYWFDAMNVTIVKGAASAPENALHFEDVLDLDPDKVFVLPVVVKAAGADILDERAVNYYVFRRSGIITVVANMNQGGSGVYAKVNWTDRSLINDAYSFTYEALMYATFSSDGQVTTDANMPVGHEQKDICVPMGCEDWVQFRYWLKGFGSGSEMSWMGLVYKASVVYKPGKRTASEQFDEFPDRTWFHMAVVYDYDAGTLSWYKDGKLMHVDNSVGRIKFQHVGTGDGNNQNFLFGTGYENSRWWPGCLSEVRIWNRALSAEEIGSDFHPYYVDADTAEGLVGYWKFNEGSGDIIHDFSGNGNHAEVYSPVPIRWEKVDLP